MSVFLIVSLNPAFAEWTGDNVEGMHSGMIINKFHSGQVDGKPYFCIEAFKPSTTITACSVKDTSIWGASYNTLYDQAMYYYTTGKRIRVYYAPDVWTNNSFVRALTANALVGFSTCISESSCFGPDRKKHKFTVHDIKVN
ncbi:subtilase cytotoxin subunit B, partial [Yersinia pestis]